MRSVLSLILGSLLLPSFAVAGDVWLPIAGSVNNFRTDTRILNPSFDKDIVVVARFLPVDNVDNSAAVSAPGVSLTIGKRQMRVFDDSVQAIFNATGLGAILLSSADEFVATSRVYSQTEIGTLGQFVPGFSVGLARTKGSLIQLKSNAAFRTNIGLASPVNAPVTVTFKLYDANNTLVATGPPITIAPYGVIQPKSIASTFFFDGTGKDLSDAWVSFTADNPIVAYASVVDNATTDPTFIPATEDVGVEPAGPATKTFNITARQWNFDIAEGSQIRVKKGDRVVLNVTSRDVAHGISIERYAPLPQLLLNNQTVRIEFNADTAGTFQYFCTESGCGAGHITMDGELVVEP